MREAQSLLRDVGITLPRGGPLSEQGGLFWVSLSERALASAIPRLPLLGYTQAIDHLEPASSGERSSRNRLVRWRGQTYHLRRVYEEDAATAREQAPDRRVFVIETGDGVARPIRGYRGDGGALSRRGLPVADARLLVNLVYRPERGTLLDPFAGVGGIAIAAQRAGWCVVTADIDPVLRHGLVALGGHHVVADTTRLPLADSSIDVIATEPPYDKEANEQVVRSLSELHRVLRPTGSIAMLSAAHQSDRLRREAAALGFVQLLEIPINRKSLPVTLLFWEL